MNLKEFVIKHKKPILWSSVGIICGGLLISLLGISLSNNKNSFVFGNYSSYMSPEVEKELHNTYQLTFDNYETSDAIPYNLKRNNMDFAVATTYEVTNLIKNDLIQVIDWTKFAIDGINDATSALNLFTQATQTVLTMDIDYDGNNDNLLEYGIPYFIQDLVFIYRGEKNQELDDNASWNDIFEFIKNDSRFNPIKSNSKMPLLGLIDDNRTMYSLAKIIDNEQKNIQINNQSISPKKNEDIDSLTESYKVITDYINHFGIKSVFFSDSNTLLNKVAINELHGAIMYNGDGIFAAYGGDDEVEINADDFHVIKPSQTLTALDMVVINKSLSGSKLNNAYEILNDLCLSFDSNENAEEQLSYLNFDYVNYTPTLQSLYDYVQSDYFSDSELNNQLLTLFQIDNVVCVEDQISKLVKSNLSFAYIAFKNSL